MTKDDLEFLEKCKRITDRWIRDLVATGQHRKIDVTALCDTILRDPRLAECPADFRAGLAEYTKEMFARVVKYRGVYIPHGRRRK